MRFCGLWRIFPSGRRRPQAPPRQGSLQTLSPTRSPTSAAVGRPLTILAPPNPGSIIGNGLAAAPAATVVSPVPLQQTPAPSSASLPRTNQTISLAASTPSTTQLLSLWEQALAKLQPEDLEGIDLKKQGEIQILHEFIKGTEQKKKECEDKRWSYENTRGEKVYLRGHVDALLNQLNKYALIGNIAIQHHPDIVTLAWAGFRFLLQVATADMEIMKMIFESLEYLVRVLGRCDIYEKLYTQRNLQAVKPLDDSLLNLYVSVLEYLCYARRHLNENTAVRFLKSTFSELGSHLRKVESFEGRVEVDANTAEKEAAEIHNTAQEEGTARLQKLLTEIQPPVFRIERTVADIYTSINDEKQRQILMWLSDVTFINHHKFVQNSRHPKTGEWLLKHVSFLDWKASRSSPIFWLHGIAGSGKTMLASKVIDALPAEPQKHAIAYFYCNFKEKARRDPATILRTLIKQLCLIGAKNGFPHPVLSMYEKRVLKGDSGPLSLEESQDLLVQISTGFLHTTIVIDGLDECDRGTRRELLNALEYVASSPNLVKVFLTSRDDGDLAYRLSKKPNIYIHAANNSKDIKEYIDSEIECCIKDGLLLPGKEVTSDLKESIILTLEEGACGMFMWVKFQILSICQEVTPGGVRDVLKELPMGLERTYSEILVRITNRSKETSRIAKKIFMWLLYATAPLSPEETTEAISAQPMESSLNTDGLSLSDILDVCQNLVVFDKGIGVLRFAHFSVQEYLLRQPEFSQGDTAHTSIAEVCLTLLSLHYSGTPRALMKYAAGSWAVHLRLSGNGSSSLAKLWKGFLTLSGAYQAWNSTHGISDLTPKDSEVLPPLYVACYYELWDIFNFLLEAGPTMDVNSANKFGVTPLHHAAKFDNTYAAKILLAIPGVDVNCKLTTGCTPLLWAVTGKHERFAQMLLENEGVDVNCKDITGRTPLLWAVTGGHEIFVQMLLEKEGVDVNCKGTMSQTPLLYAIHMGHEAIVQMLLGKEGVDVNCKDIAGHTPLLWAVTGRHERFVQMLLKKEGVDVNCKSETGQTPLLYAIHMEHEAIVQMLLEKEGVDVNCKDTDGQTPLSYAVAARYETIAQMLLKRGADVNS